MNSDTDLGLRKQSRYARQSRLPEIGEAGQRRLQEATVAVVGVGALGSVAAELLCRSGIGRLLLIDRDCVELSNLHRQSLYTEADAAEGMLKAKAAARRLGEINGEVQVVPRALELSGTNAPGLLEDADLIIDGTDNLYSRYAINDAALELGVPWVHGAATATYGVVLSFMPGGKPCFRCYAPPQEGGEAGGCAVTGVLPATTHIVAARQVAEGMKILLTGEATGGMIYIDPWYTVEQRMEVPPRIDCPRCGEAADAEAAAGGSGTKLSMISEPPKYEELCGDDTIRVRPEGEKSVPLDALGDGLPADSIVSSAEGVLRFRAEETEVTLFGDGRALIRGAGSRERARHIYTEYVGA